MGKITFESLEAVYIYIYKWVVSKKDKKIR